MSDNAKKEYARQVDKEHEGFMCFRNALMQLLWKEDRPLSRAEILKGTEGRNWNPSSIHLILNSMMSKGIIHITDETKRYGRTYETLCSYQDYVMDSLQEIFPSVEKDELLNAVMDAFVLKNGKVSKRSLNYIRKYVDEKREGIK